MNATSSRAHGDRACVRRLEPDGSEISRVSLVDLAKRAFGRDGRHRRATQGGRGDQQVAQRAGQLHLRARRSRRGQIRHEDGAYRDSTLTLLLRESLGGGLAHGDDRRALLRGGQLRGDLGTLRFADRARNIVSSATVNREMRESSPGSGAWDEKPATRKTPCRQMATPAPRRRSRSRRRAGRREDALPPAPRRRWNARYEPSRRRALTEEFDVAIQPTLVGHGRARIRAPAAADDVDHELEVAIDVTWDDTGRKSNWPTATLEAAWRSGARCTATGWRASFTSEAADAISSAAAVRPPRCVNSAPQNSGRNPRVFPRHGDGVPGHRGSGRRATGTLGVRGAVHEGRAPLGESAAVDDPRDALESRCIFSCASNAPRGCPAAVGTRDDPAPSDAANARPTTGAVTATFCVRYHGRFGPGWEPYTRRPPCLSSPSTSPRARRDRGFRGGGGGGGGGGTAGGAAAAPTNARTRVLP